MDKFIDRMMFLIIIILLIGCVYEMLKIRHDQVAVFYDCRIAEISPDVPPLVKQECRKRMEKR
jgi:hypothetical protein